MNLLNFAIVGTEAEDLILLNLFIDARDEQNAWEVRLDAAPQEKRPIA